MSEEKNQQRNKTKLYAFPGGAAGDKPGGGPVWATNRLYRCQKCGNTRVFYGRTVVEAVITVAAVRPFQYEVTQYEITESDRTKQVVTTCAQCGSYDVTMYEVDIDTPSLKEVRGDKRVHVIMTEADPLPPHERDVVLGPDGRWYIGCQRTDDYIRMEQYLKATAGSEKEMEPYDNVPPVLFAGPPNPDEDMPF